MAVTRTTSTGFFGNLLGSFVSIPIGILLFLGAFVVLFLNEGRPNMAKIAEKQSVAVAADTVGSEGEFVSVTGTLATTETLGDPLFVAPGAYVALERDVEVYAWVERSESETRDKLGGGTETVTTYTYERQWVSDPADSSTFQEPAGHQNTAKRLEDGAWRVTSATIGAWRLDVPNTRMPGTTQVAPGTLSLTGDAAAATSTVQGNHVYLGGANPASPAIGDHRVSFSVLAPGGTVTGFGEASGGALAPWNYKGDRTFLRVLEGSREDALATLAFEEKIIAWGLRILGFLMMWIGMGMVFAPLHAVAGILPFAKKATKFIVGAVTFPIAAVLTIVTIVVSMILHNIFALIIVALLVVGLGVWLWKSRDKGAAQASTAAAP